MWFTVGLSILASCRFPFFTLSPANARALRLQHLGIFRQLCVSRIQWLGEVALRSLLAGASASWLSIAHLMLYCSLKVAIALLMSVAALAACARPIAALAALVEFAK